MDSEALRKKRQEDIEAKRRRLEEMRKSRQDVASAAPAHNTRSTSAPAPAPAAPEPEPIKSEVDAKLETEALVNALLAEPVKQEAVSSGSASSSTNSREEALKEKIAKFSTVKSFNVVDILPCKKEMYEKGTQMEEEDLLFLNGAGEQVDDLAGEPGSIGQADAGDQTPDATPAKGVQSPSPAKLFFSPAKQQQNIPDLEAELAFLQRARTQLSEQERAKITSGAGFQRFLRTASLYVERALELAGEHDVIRDFSVDDKGAGGDLDEHCAFAVGTAGSSSSGAATSTFEEEHLVGRPVMDLQWSHLVPELFLAAYGAKAAAPASGQNKATASSRNAGTVEEEAPGMVCVWSRDLHSRPEYRFTASSPVLAAVFHSQEQHLVLGGCYSGQILLWDMKTNKALPVQRSSMSGKGHKHPVYAMAMTSSAVAAELVSVSTDGLLCHWDVSRLTDPITVVQLHLPSPTANPSTALSMAGFLSPIRDAGHSAAAGAQQSPLNISAMAFAHSSGDHSSGSAVDAVGAADLIFGCGSGQLVRTPLPYRDNHPSAAKVEAHFGFITAIEPHPSRSNKYKHLLLSSSLDWTVKLWDLKDFTQPIFEFFTPSYDYVCDVQWSPIHPAVFVTVTSGGRLSLWNLAKSTTEPVDAVDIGGGVEEITAGVSSASLGRGAEGAAGAAGAGTARALNKVVWARDGLSVLCGDSSGTLHMLKLHPTAVQTSPQEESRFESAIVSRALEAHVAEETKLSMAVDTTPKKVSEGVAIGEAAKGADSELNFALE